MPRINEALKNLLTDNILNDKEGTIAALDAILSAGYDTPNAQKQFRQAVLDRRVFWNKYLPQDNQIPVNPKIDGDSFLCKDGVNAQDVDGDEGNKFESLAKLALAKRTELTLKDADESQLQDIIQRKLENSDDKKAFLSLLVNNDGTNKFGSPVLKVANWDQTKDVFSEAEATRLKTEAKRQLLLKKINDCNDMVLINNLLANKDNIAAFKAEVRKLFGVQSNDPHIADQITWDPVVNDAVKHAAAQKAVSLHLNKFKEQDILKSLPLLTARDRDQFQQALVAAGKVIVDALPDDKAYMNSVKKEVGAQFLILKAAKLKEAEIERMQDVAATSDLGVAKATLKQIPDLNGAGDNTYIDLAVTEDSLPQIREACAVNALKIRISQCNDPATLDALLKVTNLAILEQVLTEERSLGYADRSMFHKAFYRENPPVFKSIVAAAHIRKNLTLSNKPELLKKLINATTPDEFRKNYHEHFSVADRLQDAINTHFDEENVKLAREEALLAYVKATLPEQDDDYLTKLVNAKNLKAVRKGIAILLKGKGADDLLRQENVSNDLDLKLLRSAAIEFVIRKAKAERDLSKNSGDDYNDLLKAINNFAFGNQSVQALLSELPEKEKHSLQTHMAQSLIRNFPRLGDQAPNIDNRLVELAKVKDLDDFRHLLTNKFEVTNTAWVTKESMEQIQKSACLRVIELNESLIFGSKTHPQLFKLIENLPQEKRLALLAKPAVLTDLIAASNKAEVERILGGVRVVSDALIKGLIKENKNIALFAKIVNYEVAATLAQIKPPINITSEQVVEINHHLLGNDFRILFKTSDPRPTEYEKTIQYIATIIVPNPNVPALYTAFGLEANGSLANMPTSEQSGKLRSIAEQQRYNNILVEKYRDRGTDLRYKAIIANLLPFRKTKELDEGYLASIADDMRGDSLAEFHENVKSPRRSGRDDYPTAFNPPLLQQLTPQIYDEIKIGTRINEMESDDKYEASLDAQEGQIKGLEKKFSKVHLDSDASESLQRLSRASLMYSFNPAFQASAKKNAKEMAPVIRELSKQCESYIAYYTNLQREAKLNAKAAHKVYMAAGSSKTKKETLLKTRDKWVKIYNEIWEELDLLRRLQTIYAGDPDNANPVIRQGLLKTLKEAEAGSRDIQILGKFTTHSHDYANSERSKHFAPDHIGAENPNPEPEEGTGILVHNALKKGAKAPKDPLFKIVDAIPKGSFREHTLQIHNNNPRQDEQALYLEERLTKDLAAEINPAGEMDYQSSLRLTATKIPTSKEGKVALAMSMAMKAVAALKESPTAENPIIVRGLNNPEFAKYLWTALMVIGDSDPNFKFGKEALKMNAGQVDVDKEFTFYGAWSADSVYKTVFKNSLTCKNMLEPIVEINKKRFGKDKLKYEKMVNDAHTLNTFFKAKLENNEIKKEVKDAQETKPTLGSSLK